VGSSALKAVAIAARVGRRGYALPILRAPSRRRASEMAQQRLFRLAIRSGRGPGFQLTDSPEVPQLPKTDIRITQRVAFRIHCCECGFCLVSLAGLCRWLAIAAKIAPLLAGPDHPPRCAGDRRARLRAL
jgi:hypothetical protein